MPAPYKVTFAYRDFFGEVQHGELKQPFPFLQSAIAKGKQVARDMHNMKALTVHIEDEDGFITAIRPEDLTND